MEEFEELKKFLDSSTARINYQDKWIVFDDGYWFVYQNPQGRKVFLLLETDKFLEALSLLNSK